MDGTCAAGSSSPGQQLRDETADQAEVIDLLERDERAAQSEAARSRDGVPEEVWSSQSQALRQCKDLSQDCAERTGYALLKAQSRLPVQPAAASTMPRSIAPELAGEQWWHEGPHRHNLFKWHAVHVGRAQ